MDLVSRLKTYLESRGISVTQFADECGIPRPTGSQLLAGRNKKVSDEIIGKIHNAYPDLNIVWLMFGEGNMEIGSNIQTSEPQIVQNPTALNHQQTDSQTSPLSNSYSNPLAEKGSEKNQYGPQDKGDDKIPTLPGFGYENTFVFATPPDAIDHGQASNPTTSDISAEYPEEKNLGDSSKQDGNGSITLTPGKGKRVTGIVVYYDDSTYESFVPDPNHSHPFIAR